METHDDAVLWIHETVGSHLDGDASLEDCIRWIRQNGTDIQRHELQWHVLPLIEKDDAPHGGI